MGIAAVVLVAVLIIMGVLPGLKPSTPATVTLRVWSIEPAEAWEAFAKEFSAAHSGVTLLYEEKDPLTYEQDLLNALASGTGPDIFSLPNAGVEAHISKIIPLPDGSSNFSVDDFKKSFFDGASPDLISGGQMLGVPYAVDPLALFYNRDYFNSANIPAPPKTWDEFVEDVRKLTVYSETGFLVRSGAALGSADNITHYLDLLASLFLQSGLSIVGRGQEQSDVASNQGEEALSFYTSFTDASKRTYTWSPSFSESFGAFAGGKTAMVFGFASDVPLVFQKNPHLSFDTALFPQFAGVSSSVYSGRYRILVVSRQAALASDAWTVLLSFADPAYAAIIPESLGLAPAERTRAADKAPVSYLQPFYDEVLSLKTWRIYNESELSDIFKEMVTSVITKRATPDDAVRRASDRIDLFTRREQ